MDPRVILEQELSSYHRPTISLERLYKEISGNEILWRSTPTIAPVEDPSVSSHYGKRRDPFTNLPAFHSGIDFSGPAGTPIYAPADGIVRKAGPAAGYGLLVELDHGSGISQKISNPLITRRATVTCPVWRYRQTNSFIVELLGYTGNTGRSTVHTCIMKFTRISVRLILGEICRTSHFSLIFGSKLAFSSSLQQTMTHPKKSRLLSYSGRTTNLPYPSLKISN